MGESTRFGRIELIGEGWKRRLHSVSLNHAVKLPVEPEVGCEDNIRLSGIGASADLLALLTWFAGIASPMPIRFRCSYCSQLLGISRRKTGTSVRCPTCAGQVLVPDQDDASTVLGKEDPNPFVFDRNDFDGLLQGEIAAPIAEPVVANGVEAHAAPIAPAPPGAWGTHAEPSYLERSSSTKPALQNEQIVRPTAGLYLSRNQLILAGVLAGMAIVLAFGIGLAMGLMLGTPAKTGTTFNFSKKMSAPYYV
jgi:hypothetical protein